MKAKVSNLEISQRETPNHPSIPQNPDQPEQLQGHLKKKKEKRKERCQDRYQKDDSQQE